MKQGLLACALVVVALAGCTQTLQTRSDKAAARGSANASVAEHRQSAEALERQATKAIRPRATSSSGAPPKVVRRG